LLGHLGDLELHGSTGLDDRAGANVLDLEADQVWSSQLAVDRKVEQGEVP
jgi:hypothetical protein